MLDIHPGSGQPALEAAGLTEGFRKLVLPGRQSARVVDRHGTVLLDRPDDGTGDRPEVQRRGVIHCLNAKDCRSRRQRIRYRLVGHCRGQTELGGNRL